MTTSLTRLVALADETLEPQRIADYCPNGLQVEGRSAVNKLVSGVTASQALIDAAVEAGADAILVHHGFFWKGEDPCVCGMKRRRLAALLGRDISLLAYHLPLDVHSELGNNVQLAKRLALQVEGPLDPAAGAASVGLVGRLETPMSADAFSEHLARSLGRAPLHISGGDRPVERVAWCTGGAQGYIEKAVALDVDAYITGEVSEPTVHIARETGTHFFAAGHHATERYGVQALGEFLALTLGIEHQFIDIDNPV